MSSVSGKIVLFKPKYSEDRSKIVAKLFEEHSAALRTFLCVRMTEVADIDDIIQDVFVKLAGLEDLAVRIKPARGSVRSFILTMASNMLIDKERSAAVRRRYCHQQGDMEMARLDELSPQVFTEDAQILNAVQETVLNMEARMRWVFIQSRVNFKTYPQIAEEMGVSVKLIDKLMARALTAVRIAVARATGGVDNDR